MKKLFTFISAMVIAASMQSCEGPAGPEGPMGPMGPAGQDGSSFYYINKEFTVEKGHWIGDGECFYYEFKVPELTKEVCESAVINAYCYNEDFQNPLPYVTFHYIDKDAKNPVTGEITTEPYRWTRTVRFDYTPGMLTFVVNYSDFNDEDIPPTMDFRLVVHY